MTTRRASAHARTTTTTRRAGRGAGRGAELVRAGGSALALLTLLTGLPTLLVLVVGDPFPRAVPTGHAVHHALTSPLADRTVVNVLAVLAWLVWASLLIAVLRELLAQLRGLPLPRRLPLLGTQQAVARQLVAGLLLLAPSINAAHAAPVTALTRAPATASVTTATHLERQSPLALSADTHSLTEVGPRSEHPAGLDHAHGRAGVDGHERARKFYVVQPPDGQHYDSLWDIAARHLGDGRRYTEIYELNRDRPQPSGGQLTHASLIQPGWVLFLPDDAHGPGVRDTEPAPTPPRAHAPAAQQHAGPAAHPTTAPHPATPRQPAHADATPPSPAATRTGHDDRGQTTSHQAGEQIPALPLGLGLGLGSIALVAALTRARRRALRTRPLGTRLPAPPAPLRRVEHALRAEAITTRSTADDVRLVLRLADTLHPHSRTGAGSGFAVVVHHPDRVELHTIAAIDTEAHTPAPFRPIDGGWALPARDLDYAFGIDPATDPAPALLELGPLAAEVTQPARVLPSHAADDTDTEADDNEVRDEDAFDDDGHDPRANTAATVFVDLLAVGRITIDGDRPAVEDLVLAFAARLSAAPWARELSIVMPPELAARLEALPRVHVAGEHVEPAQPQSQGHARVLLGWPADQLAAVGSNRSPEHAPTTVITIGADPGAAHHWHLGDDLLTGDLLPGPISTAGIRDGLTAAHQLLDHTFLAAPTAAPEPEPPQHDADRAAVPQPSTTDATAAPTTPPATPTPTPTVPAMAINVLGPVEYVGIELLKRRTPTLQALLFLAMHRRGVTVEQLTTSLWPDDPTAAKTGRNRVIEARLAVGGAITTGRPWRLEPSVGCDWQDFQELAAGTHADRLAALELVRGEPFAGTNDPWIDVEMHRTDIVAAIIDLAVDVATKALEDGAPDQAYRAARAGLRACPYEERLVRLAMQAADAEGSTGKIRALMDELNRLLGIVADPDSTAEQADPETLALYTELTSLERRRARAGVP